jgi:hypothetical protein
MTFTTVSKLHRIDNTSSRVAEAAPSETGRGTGTTRHLVLIDVENLAGTAAPTPLELSFVETKLREVVDDLDEAQRVVACSHVAARTAAFAFPGAGRRWRSGPDGADLALIEEMNDLRIMKRFERVTLVSGDGIFADSLAALAVMGIETTVVSRESSLSRRLRMAAGHVIALAEDEATLGGALMAPPQRYEGSRRARSSDVDRGAWSCGRTEQNETTDVEAAR